MASKVYAISWILNSIAYETLYPALAKRVVSLHFRLWKPPKKVASFLELHPEKLLHGAIFAFGHVYEFSDTEGIWKSEVDAEKGDFPTVCNVSSMSEKKFLGTTQVSQVDFESWLATEKDTGRFSKSKYDITNNHCIVFAIAAANFLFPEKGRVEVDIYYLRNDTKKPKRTILVAYGYGFEFTEEEGKGLRVRKVKSLTVDLWDKVRGPTTDSPKTCMSQGDFEKWLENEMKNGGRFAKNAFDAENNNCLHFATTAFQYLTGYPKDWEKICKFTNEFPKLCQTGHILTGCSPCETSSSLPYQQNLEKKMQQGKN